LKEKCKLVGSCCKKNLVSTTLLPDAVMACKCVKKRAMAFILILESSQCSFVRRKQYEGVLIVNMYPGCPCSRGKGDPARWEGSKASPDVMAYSDCLHLWDQRAPLPWYHRHSSRYFSSLLFATY
jgi:hypothetical protein